MLKPKLRLWMLVMTLIGRLLLVTEVRAQFVMNKKVSVENVLNGGNWNEIKSFYRLLNPRFAYQKEEIDEDGRKDDVKTEKEYYEEDNFGNAEEEDKKKEYLSNKLSKNKKISDLYKAILKKKSEQNDFEISENKIYERNNNLIKRLHFSPSIPANEEHVQEYDWKTISDEEKKLKRFVAGFDNIKFIDEHIHARETGFPAPEYPVNLTQNFQSRQQSNKSKQQFQNLLRKAG